MCGYASFQYKAYYCNNSGMYSLFRYSNVLYAIAARLLIFAFVRLSFTETIIADYTESTITHSYHQNTKRRASNGNGTYSFSLTTNIGNNHTITTDTQQSTRASPVKMMRSCEEWRYLFANLNHYFRDDDILQGSDHSSIAIGYLIIASYSVVITFGAIGNLFTIAAVLRNPQMRTVRNFFILNLALSDFLICTVTAPITLYTVLYMFWPFGTAFCKIVGSLQGFNIFLSTFSIAAIALDRYVLVIFPTQRDRQKNLALLFFLLIWLISILLALPLFVASDLERVFEDKQCKILLTICHEQNQRWKQMIISKEMYTVGVLFIQYAFPLASIVFAYSRIARRMGSRFAPQNSYVLPPPNITKDSPTNDNNKVNGNGKSAGNIVFCDDTQTYSKKVAAFVNGYCTNYGHKNDNNNNIVNDNNKIGSNNSAQSDRIKRSKDRYRRTNFLLIAVVCVFAAAWLPLNIFHLINTFLTVRRFSVPVFALCHCLAIGSACLNPVSYAFFNHHFRAEFASIFKKLRLTWLHHYFANISKTLRLREVNPKSAKRRKWIVSEQKCNKPLVESQNGMVCNMVNTFVPTPYNDTKTMMSCESRTQCAAIVDSTPTTVIVEEENESCDSGCAPNTCAFIVKEEHKDDMDNEDEASTHYL